MDMNTTCKEYTSIDEPITNATMSHRHPVEIDNNYPTYHKASAEDTNGNEHELSIDDAIERLGMGKFQRRILWAAGLCFAADSMEILLLSFLTVVLQAEFHLTDTQASTITFSVFAGALLGSLVLGPLGDIIGRRPVFSMAACIISVFGLGTALVNSYHALLLVRFLVGFGVGGLTVPFDTLSEFLPTSHRGVNLLVIEYFWTGGSLLVPVFAYLTLGNDSSGSWKLFVVLCALPCVISSILGVFVVTESPLWLCARGRSEEALAILRNAAKTNGHDPFVLFPEGTVLASKEKHSTVRDLFSPQWKWITLRLWGAWAGFAFLYYGTILAVTLIFSSDKEARANGTYEFDYTAIFASSSAEIVGLTVVIFTVDTIGRIPSQTFCYIGGGSSVFLMCLFASMNSHRGILLSFSFLSRLFMMGATSLTWVSTSEILSTEVRTTGHAAANAIARIGGSLSPFLISERTPLLAIGIVMLCISLTTARFVSKLPETKGVAMGVAAAQTHPDDPTDHSETELSASSEII
jgi:putative MFS transporter